MTITLIAYNPEPVDLAGLKKLAHVYRLDFHVALNTDQVSDLTRGRRIALEHTRGAVPLNKWTAPPQHYTVVTGAMNHGLPREVLDMCEEAVVIETFDDVGFLSPTMAASIFVHEMFQRGPNKDGLFG